MLLTLVLVGLTITVVHAGPEMKPASSAGLEPLKFLIGTWEGKATDGKPVRVTYELTSGGSAIEETIVKDKDPNMKTLYHVDGNRLMLTHYCSLGNQPRMAADIPKGEFKKLQFAFVDASNLASPNDPHMHTVAFNVQDRDHMTQDWVLSQDGKEMTHTFTLQRKK
jgi:hypothetical protein